MLLLHSTTSATTSAQGQAGSIRGVVYDLDFEVPLPLAKVSVVETGDETTTSEQGSYRIGELAPGAYTVIFAKEGYVRQVKANVVVMGGQLTDLDVSLAGDFTDMDEFVVQALQLGGGSEASLLALRLESPAFMDSIGANLLTRAGASDAAGALQLVSGATVQDGKFAVIRGLPDRYVSSQLNGVRLPSADEDTRAVELDQFPAAVIESLQVTKTFTPDQQGDASGGAVDVRIKGIPEETFLEFKAEVSFNSQVVGSDFLSYDGGGVNAFGFDDGERRIQSENLGGNWDGAVGVSRVAAPLDFKWSAATGGRTEVGDGAVLGGFASAFYERDSSYYDDGKNDSLWALDPGDPLTPQLKQDGAKTALFDITQATQSVQWGGIASTAIETDDHRIGLSFLYSHTAEDKVTLAEDTRGKEFFFPDYDPDDPSTPGHDDPLFAPYIRTETLEYTERTTGSLQLTGSHVLPLGDFGSSGSTFGKPELDWTASMSFAQLDQPDKRQFGTEWRPALGTLPPLHVAFKPAANFTLGNLQRIFKEIEEDSNQLSVNLRFPFEQWGDERGFLKFGLFADRVDRTFDQDTYSNFSDGSVRFIGDFEDYWSANFPFEDHPITESDFDVDYDGKQDIGAYYGMIDLPLSSTFKLIGGARVESTEISIVNDPEPDALWLPPGSAVQTTLNPGEADVDFSQDDVLPSIGFVYEPRDVVTFRAAYSQTVARQTFKELTPIIQQEFLGGPIFIGNKDLQMAALANYDLRLDYQPYESSLASVSWFYKDVDDPIEYVQRLSTEFSYTTAVNYPSGYLTGFEFEVRQQLGQFWDALEGLGVGGNATFIDSQVTLSDEDAMELAGIGAPTKTRDALNAPEHLYNLYLTYDHVDTGVEAGLFYTVKGDTLVAGGASEDGNLVPDIYAKEYGTLNFTLGKRFGNHVKLQFKAKNLTNPVIREVYRSDFVPGGDVTRSSYTRGQEFSIGFSITN